MTSDPTTDSFAISTAEEYRALRGDGGQAMYDKSMDVIDDHIREFLALTTFVTIASIDADGNMDVSPKGDPPGFIKVLDDTTIAIPERAGNRRSDTFTNVLENPSVGLICLVPGMDETMRINGSASLTTNPALMDTMEVEGHVPALALVVHVEEAFIHCGRAVKRGRVWDPEAQIDRSIYPSVGEVLFDHGKFGDAFTLEQIIEMADCEYERNIYPADDT